MLDPAEALAALWELFWAGLATPDTFSAIVAAGAAPRRAQRAYDAVGADGVGARRAASSRTCLSSGAGARSPRRSRSRPKSARKRAPSCCSSRYGVVARELARGDWTTLRHTLLRMEYGGDVVRGYFVEGLSGEQYALADALSDLDAPSRAAPSRTCW